MVISPKSAEAINRQIGNEFAAFMQYVAIGAYFDLKTLPELSAYFYKQAEEEKEHALKMIQFLCDADQKVEIPVVPSPISQFESVESAVKLSYDQEVEVTEQIKAIYEVAASEKDRITESFLQWFLDEQLEEVSSMDSLLTIVRRAGDEPNLFRVEDYIARHGHPEDGA